MNQELSSDTQIGDVPGLSNPARRALAEHGYGTLGAFDGADWKTLAKLHGVGPKAGAILNSLLSDLGMTLLNAPAAVAPVKKRASGSTISPGSTPSNVSPADYIATLSERRAREGLLLLQMFEDVCGEPGIMWGPSMIGFGSTEYALAQGKTGETFRVGFSPRKASLVLYGVQDAELLPRLGKHKESVACVYVNSLDDVDIDILRSLIDRGWKKSEPNTSR